MELQVTAAKLSGDPERDVKTLSNHVFQLEEQLRYTLRNLDVTNFNDLGLARYENGRLQFYAEQVKIQTDALRVEFGKETEDIYAKIDATANGLSAEIKTVDGKYTTLEASVNGLSTRVGKVEGNYSSLTQTVNGIQTTVNSHTTSINNQTETNTSLQSQIKQTASKISAVVSAVDDSSGNVTAASIVAAINAAGSSVRISADHVELVGDYVTISDLAGNGTVEINAGNIAAGGTISGCVLKTRDGGYARMTIDTDTIDFGDIAMIGLSTRNDLGIFADKGKLELYGQSGVRIYTADGGDYYWTFHSWGIAVWDATTDEVIGEIEATIY